MTEPFTILFLLLATYFVLFSEKRHYLAAGLCAGIAFGYNRFLKDRTPDLCETYFLISAVGFSLTLLIRQYLHYWALALPFLATL